MLHECIVILDRLEISKRESGGIVKVECVFWFVGALKKCTICRSRLFIFGLFHLGETFFHCVV